MKFDSTCRVLIINDDPLQLRMAGKLIEKAGYDAILSESAEEALKTLQREDAPDLIITDLYMPGIDGWRLCRLLRSPAFPRTNRTPILVLSATFAGADTEEITQQIGANAFLPAPYDPPELIRVVGELLQGQAEARRSSVLLVEDADAQRSEVVGGLRANGYEVFEAQDGESARRQFDEHHPQVVLLAYHLPDTTAAELLPLFKSAGSDRVVIVMTKDPSPDLAVELLRSGADAYVRKPFDLAYLVDLVTESLRQRALLRVQDVLEERTRQLRASEARYRAIVEDQTDQVFRFLPDGTLTFVNNAFCRYFGKKREELVGQSLMPLIPEQDHEKSQAHLASLTQQQPVGTVEHQIVDANGQTRWLQRTDRATFDDQGRLIEFQCVGRDVTDRNQAEEALKASLKQIMQAKQEWESTADSLPQLVCLLDAQGRIARANRTVEHWDLGQVEDLKLRDMHELLHPDCTDPACHMRALWPNAWKEVTQGRSAEYEAEDLVLGRYLSVQVRPMSGQKTWGPQEPGSFAVVTVEDVTDRKHAEQALRDERASLAQRVEERTAELSAANVELARAARLKDEFLASMSHEFRTPLSTILGMSEALQEHVYGPCTEEQHKSLRGIQESGHHLLDLVNNILDLAKIGAGKSELQIGPVSVESVCQASLRLVTEDAQKKGLKISSTFDSAVIALQADERRLKQILTNLLSNAVKFTPEGGSIGLDVAGDADRQAVHFTVWDTGIGISKEHTDQLFQPFVQLDSKLSRQYTGSGLGLSLVHRLTELHQGGITVESEPGQGSRFTVSLPWKATAEELPGGETVATAQPEEAPSLGPHPAAKVSDAVSGRLVGSLQESGTKAMYHPGAEGAVARAAEAEPDVIILDLPLPDPQGWSVLEELRSESSTRSVPILVVSDVDQRDRAQALGATEYLINPVSGAQLQQSLDAVLSVKKEKPKVLVIRIAEAEQTPDKQLLILLVEDNEDNVTTISDYLTAKGHRIAVARNGADALERAREQSPDLILMDIQMPGMDGLEATRCIRADPQLASIPVIALTALAMPGDRERCLAAGADDYMSKPVHLKGLLQAIETQVKTPLAQV